MEIIFDTTSLTQENINFIQATVCQILFEQGVTYDDLLCVDGVCTIDNPSGSVDISLDSILAKQKENAQTRADAAVADAATLEQLKESISNASSVEDIQAIINSYG